MVWFRMIMREMDKGHDHHLIKGIKKATQFLNQNLRCLPRRLSARIEIAKNPELSFTTTNIQTMQKLDSQVNAKIYFINGNIPKQKCILKTLLSSNLQILIARWKVFSFQMAHTNIHGHFTTERSERIVKLKKFSYQRILITYQLTRPIYAGEILVKRGR